MASLAMVIGGAAINALAFSGTNFLFSTLSNHGTAERERHDLAIEKLQRLVIIGITDVLKSSIISIMNSEKRMNRCNTSTI